MNSPNVLIAGRWQTSRGTEAFHAADPAKGVDLPEPYPISDWQECESALAAASEAAAGEIDPARLSHFLTRYAERIETRRKEIVEMANLETALPTAPRLNDVELPRTTGQLRQAAAAALEGSWAMATIDTKSNIRSRLASVGPVLIFGPNNFPFAFNAVSGGDFAAAIATGSPVIAKAHPSHPGATRLLAEEAFAAVGECGLPKAMVQMIYHLSKSDGLRMASDPRIGAVAFTGSRTGGMALKAAADAAGKPVYLEMSSVNPVVILPGALRERLTKIADEFADSCLAATGQFCTNPGLVVLVAGEQTDKFVAEVKSRFDSRPAGPLLARRGAASLAAGVKSLIDAGAAVITGGRAAEGAGWRYANTLLRVSGEEFLANPKHLQGEAFGNAALLVIARDVAETTKILGQLEGNLTGCIYSETHGADDVIYNHLAAILRRRVGRLINDKMPTGVAVSSAMNHGGPYPATGHPGFTAVGIPASLRRFGRLECYDNVRHSRLPNLLVNKNPTGKTWRMIDSAWTCDDVRTEPN